MKKAVQTELVRLHLMAVQNRLLECHGVENVAHGVVVRC